MNLVFIEVIIKIKTNGINKFQSNLTNNLNFGFDRIVVASELILNLVKKLKGCNNHLQRSYDQYKSSKNKQWIMYTALYISILFTLNYN